MSNFIQIYRELLTCHLFVSSPPSYKCVLIAILANAVWAPCNQDDHGVEISLLPGQLLCTIRQLADLANVGKNDAERALSKFSLNQIVRQEVRHRKTIITILWGIKFKDGETGKETKVRQDRDTKEEDKNIKTTPPPQTPQKKGEDGEDKKKINSVIKKAKELKLPFSEAGIYTAFKETSGLAVQNALTSFVKRNPKLPPLIIPDRWLRSAAIKEHEYLEQKKDYE